MSTCRTRHGKLNKFKLHYCFEPELKTLSGIRILRSFMTRDKNRHMSMAGKKKVS